MCEKPLHCSLQIGEGHLPSIQLVSRASGNTFWCQSSAGAGQGPSVFGLRDRTTERSLLQNAGAGALQFVRGKYPLAWARWCWCNCCGALHNSLHHHHPCGDLFSALQTVFKVLGVVHELLRAGRRTTQRDLYYKVSRHAQLHTYNTAQVHAVTHLSQCLTHIDLPELFFLSAPAAPPVYQLSQCEQRYSRCRLPATGPTVTPWHIDISTGPSGGQATSEVGAEQLWATSPLCQPACKSPASQHPPDRPRAFRPATPFTPLLLIQKLYFPREGPTSAWQDCSTSGELLCGWVGG